MCSTYILTFSSYVSNFLTKVSCFFLLARPKSVMLDRKLLFNSGVWVAKLHCSNFEVETYRAPRPGCFGDGLLVGYDSEYLSITERIGLFLDTLQYHDVVQPAKKKIPSGVSVIRKSSRKNRRYREKLQGPVKNAFL